MLYKTICLQLIQDRSPLYDRLLKYRNLLSTLDLYATQLRNRHLTWQDILSQADPSKSYDQIATEAGEMALKELQDSLPPVFPQDKDDPLSLDAAMAFLHRHTPPV